MSALVRSGGKDCGATVYARRIYCHPFYGFELALVILHYGA